MAAESSRSGASADSYIGSLISLTSKCEIRYEGILYEINTEESSIGLRNVRSFGTEGRKKDGQQIPPSDKIYEHILFRGSDIKDLQVKASPPPVQATSIYNDPAIIQSHFARPPPASASLPSVGSGTFPDPSSHTAQLGLPRSPFQGSLPLYQPGGSLGSWGSAPPPPTANGTGLAMPMYWQGYYAPTSGLPHLQQSTLLRPPPGLPIPQSIQQPFQYPGTTVSLAPGSINLQEFPSPLQQPVSGTPSSTSMALLPTFSSTLSSTSATNLPSTLPPIQVSPLAPEASISLVAHKPPASSLPATTLSGNPPFASSLAPGMESVVPLSQNMPASASNVSSKPRTAPIPAAYQTVAQPMLSNDGSSSSTPVETSVPLVTPGQLLQPVHSSLPSSEPLQTSSKDLEIKPQEAKVKPLLPDPPVLVQADSKEPILPLPTQMHQRLNGAALHTHQFNRGRGRGRGYGYPRPVTKFTEDFDFSAMNEKFNKDEVWGHLGKNKGQLRENDEIDDEADDTVNEDGDESSRSDTKPVYVKDDFFDTISCNSLDRESRNGRTRFSEQMKIDTETFGDFPRQRPIRGGGRGFRGGRGRGSYYGRGYGYGGRGRGRTGPNHPF